MGIDFYYYPPSAPARMVLLLAKHLNVELNMKHVDLMKKEQMKDEFLDINPAHTIPVMVDQGLIITESRAMLSYLQNKYGGRDDALYPKVPQERVLVDQRIFFDCSMLYPRFGDAYYPTMFGGQPIDQTKIETLNEVLGHVETFVKDGYVAGDHLTIADFSMAAVLSTIETCHDLSKFPKIMAYLQKHKKGMKGWDELNQPGAEHFGGWLKDALAKQKA